MIKKVITAFLLMVSVANAGTLSVEWEYSSPPDLTLKQFNLYQEGTKVCTFPGISAELVNTKGDCETTLTKYSTTFYLEAEFTTGEVSPKSEGFVFKSLDRKGRIVSIRKKN